MDASDLLPPDGGLNVRGLALGPDLIQIDAEATGPGADRPRCGSHSDRVHGRYARTVADLPWQGRRARIRIHIRRFKCNDPGCPRRTFAERVPAVAAQAQTTTRLAAARRTIGFALGGGPGARLARRPAMPTGPDTLLRRVRAAGPDVRPTRRALGVDDFASRRASTDGTILVDLGRGRAVDLLPDREAATLARWPHGHPGVEVIGRDRASAYAQAAREAAPDAVQVADRRHLLANLRDALERSLQRRPAVVREVLPGPAPAPDNPPASATQPVATDSGVSGSDGRVGASEQRAARFERVRRLHADGMSLRGIARAPGLHYRTVERHVRSDACPDWQPGRHRPSIRDRYEGDIRGPLEGDCGNSSRIHGGLQGLGCRCGKTVVKDDVRRLKAEKARPPSPRYEAVGRERPAFVSFRRLAVAIVRRADGRSAEGRELLGRLNAGAAEIREALELAEGFAALVRGRRPPGLGAWPGRAGRGTVPELRPFACRLRQDEAAVRAGIELKWSNGPTEGHVNRLKLVKRAMYGRAGFDLLRARVLNTG